MDWIESLKDLYGSNEPILFKEIYAKLDVNRRESAHRLINEAIKENKLERFDYGVYYFPTKTMLGRSSLSSLKVVNKKYITDGVDTYGFYTGETLMNKLGQSTQVPFVWEISTNNESTRGRLVNIGNQKVFLRKSRTEINNDNVKQLMLLEAFNLVEPKKQKTEFKENVIDYMKKNNLMPKDLLLFADIMPAKAIKNFISSEVMYAFT